MASPHIDSSLLFDKKNAPGTSFLNVNDDERKKHRDEFKFAAKMNFPSSIKSRLSQSKGKRASLVKSQPQLKLAQEIRLLGRELFHLSDYDRDGYVTRGEFKDLLMQNVKIQDFITDDLDVAIRSAFEALDSTQRDKISMEEFLPFYADICTRFPAIVPDEKRATWAKEEEMTSAVPSTANGASRSAQSTEKNGQRLDAETKGLLQSHLSNEGEDLLTLDNKMVRRIFNLYDKDESGLLDVAEIRAMIKDMGIRDYKQDKFVGFIRLHTKSLGVAKESELDYDEFYKLIQSLVTCKCNLHYRALMIPALDAYCKEDGSENGPNVGVKELGLC